MNHQNAIPWCDLSLRVACKRSSTCAGVIVKMCLLWRIVYARVYICDVVYVYVCLCVWNKVLKDGSRSECCEWDYEPRTKRNKGVPWNETELREDADVVGGKYRPKTSWNEEVKELVNKKGDVGRGWCEGWLCKRGNDLQGMCQSLEEQRKTK